MADQKNNQKNHWKGWRRGSHWAFGLKAISPQLKSGGLLACYSVTVVCQAVTVVTTTHPSTVECGVWPLPALTFARTHLLTRNTVERCPSRVAFFPHSKSLTNTPNWQNQFQGDLANIFSASQLLYLWGEIEFKRGSWSVQPTQFCMFSVISFFNEV